MTPPNGGDRTTGVRTTGAPVAGGRPVRLPAPPRRTRRRPGLLQFNTRIHPKMKACMLLGSTLGIMIALVPLMGFVAFPVASAVSGVGLFLLLGDSPSLYIGLVVALASTLVLIHKATGAAPGLLLGLFGLAVVLILAVTTLCRPGWRRAVGGLFRRRRQDAAGRDDPPHGMAGDQEAWRR